LLRSDDAAPSPAAGMAALAANPDRDHYAKPKDYAARFAYARIFEKNGSKLSISTQLSA
jgi:hypothetical protein